MEQKLSKRAIRHLQRDARKAMNVADHAPKWKKARTRKSFVSAERLGTNWFNPKRPPVLLSPRKQAIWAFGEFRGHAIWAEYCNKSRAELNQAIYRGW